MSESLSGIPVRLVLAKNLDELRQKIEMVCMNNVQTKQLIIFNEIVTIHHSLCMFLQVDPLLDRFVLIHGLSEEALDVAVSNEPGKCSDVDKGKNQGFFLYVAFKDFYVYQNAYAHKST